MFKRFLRILSLFVSLFIVAGISEQSFAASIDDIYKDLTILDKTPNISRKSYILTADKFYKIYISNPDGRRSDEALLGSARTHRRSYERFKIAEDIDKALQHYRILQGSFDTKSARLAFLESADIFMAKRDTASAKFTLNKLIKKFPDSAESKSAKNKIVALEKSVPSKSVITAAPPAAPKIEPELQAVNASSQSGLVTVHGIRYFSDSDYTRVVIDLSDNAKYESHWLKEDTSLQKPPRLTIDISSSVIPLDIVREISIKDGLLSSVRLGYHKEDKRTRIVLDSESVKDFTVFQMSNPSRIVVDVFSDDRGAASKPVTAAIKKPAQGDTAIRNNKGQNGAPSDITLGAALGLKIKTIVIDPGHGGKDPGAVYGNLKEKDIVLEISKYLRDYLKGDPSLNIYMTRDKDIFIPLEERTAIANKYKADIFISIHANAAKNTKASGVETFVFNVTNDRAALEVAALENQATTKSISDLQGILKDILKYSKLEESLSLAGSVQKRVVSTVGLSQSQNLGVKQAPFYVLVGARMPSILVETGFISNSNDSSKLKTSAYRKEVAKGIYKGLDEYVSKYNK